MLGKVSIQIVEIIVNDVQRLQELLDAGELLHPVSDALSVVDLANALHSILDIPNASLNEPAERIKDIIGEPEHLVVVVADGFGMNFAEWLDYDSFTRQNLAAEMRTVFPSTTPIALTSLATGQWPAAHSVIGWFQSLREIDDVSTIISYARTSDKMALSELGVGVETAYPIPSRIGNAGRESLHVTPQHLVGSAYTNYWSGGLAQIGYEVDSPWLVIDSVVNAIHSVNCPTCFFVYMPQVDSAAHKHGAAHETTLTAARDVDRLLEALADSLPGDSRVVMTADHGHLDVPAGKTYRLDASDDIFRLCDGPFTGDQRAIYANVSEGKMDAFRAAIHERYGDDFLTLTASEVEECGLLGAAPLADETGSRMGNALLLSTRGAALDYRAALGDELHPLVSHHGSLTPAEMRIPLVVA